jgi:hypothetical protein
VFERDKMSATTRSLTFCFGLLVVVLVICSIYPLPGLLLRQEHSTWLALKPVERLQLEAQLRTAMLQAIGGISIISGGVVTYRQVRLQSQQTKTAVDVSVVEAFSKASDKLTSSSPTARLAGVYALERLAQGDSGERQRVIGTLVGFVRENASAESSRTSIEAALTVITQLRRPGQVIDLSGASLARLRLTGLEMTGFILEGADLRGADLRGCELRGANLTGADLRGADFEDSATAGPAF